MAQNNPDIDEKSELDQLAIEGKLPLKAVGIENLKEANPQHMPPHRYLHPWFARRPTPASRLAVLASVLPLGVDADDLLRWMKIGPSQGTDGESIVEYVARKKSTEDERDGTLQDHYDYPVHSLSHRARTTEMRFISFFGINGTANYLPF